MLKRHKYPTELNITYTSWRSIKNRCLHKGATSYNYYGGRGITICDKWLKYSGFLEDMGERPSKEYSIDRIDNTKGYYKENCRWVTIDVQSRNKRLYKNNKSGILGVILRTQKNNWYWQAYVKHKKQFIHLYCGNDFFEACCARKSWEANLAKP